MGASRIRVAKDKADLIKALVASGDTTGPFQTYADAIAFAAALGAKRKKRSPLGAIAKKEPAPISIDIFVSRGYEVVMKLLALAETKDAKIISSFDGKWEEERILIFEEYANGGLEILRDELRGAVDYSERLVLVLNAERVQPVQLEEEFDLSRFLG
ncbi:MULTISPECIES: DNA phosphorothioation-associated protein 4 [unclassified Coleofasciculus]|uniref:DNA phosphorothioation-associated protein 4 n=1 Tax=unclassified Coleofasciculus TaxID=2692782 RepID=UPI0018823374|nr:MULTISPECIES: DNA phosphorothioation-associated protein 4 [unclassified Coleofasciculus]MBE9125279.1 DNA phosphorothioation-associated protein 4 [Coleofasciculus sp. LEGE 07081]MBE9147060.1 DNA phosphorothioation-associated protein 4 [Coleofasciculus sp. LEGE 07092]